MKIGLFVKQHIRQILNHCDTVDHTELSRLLDRDYSNRTFGLSFPFCSETTRIAPDQSMRYWTEEYIVRNKRVRVTSQWYEKHRSLFSRYLSSKGITPTQDMHNAVTPLNHSPISLPQTLPSSRRANSRYRGNPIGNAQNYFIRNLLSNLGAESFNEQDWNATKAHFAHRCAYCGAVTTLVMDHAVPINKECLGEHRLGNLVPSCEPCNTKKGGKDFRAFLEGNPAGIQVIEAYMESRNYIPLADNDQMRRILQVAHTEIGALAERYITIINELFPHDQQPESFDIDG